MFSLREIKKLLFDFLRKKKKKKIIYNYIFDETKSRL